MMLYQSKKNNNMKEEYYNIHVCYLTAAVCLVA